MRNLLGFFPARYKYNQRAEQWAPAGYLIAQHRLRYLRKRRDTSNALQSLTVSDKQGTVHALTLDKSQEGSDNKVAIRPEIIYAEEVQFEMPSLTSNSTTAIFGRPSPEPEKESLLQLSDSSSVYANLNRTPILHSPLKLNSNLHRNHVNHSKLHQRLLIRKLEALRSLNNKINNLMLHLAQSSSPFMRKSIFNNWSLYRQL